MNKPSEETQINTSRGQRPNILSFAKWIKNSTPVFLGPVFPSSTQEKKAEFFGLAFTKNNDIFFRPPLTPTLLVPSFHRHFIPLLSEKGHQGHPRATSKPASWQEQEVPSEHSGFLLSAEVTDTCLNSHTERGQMPRCQAELFYTLFPPLASANVSPVHPSPSHWRQPFFRAHCINTVWVIPDLGSSRVRLHSQAPDSALPASALHSVFKHQHFGIIYNTQGLLKSSYFCFGCFEFAWVRTILCLTKEQMSTAG